MTIQTDGSITGMIPGSGTLTFEGETDEYPVIGYASIQTWHKCPQCGGAVSTLDQCTAQRETYQIVPIILNDGNPEAVIQKANSPRNWRIARDPSSPTRPGDPS